MDAEDVATFLKVSTSMVYKLRREGALAGIQIGALWRFAPEVVRAYARRGEAPPTGGAPVTPISSRRKRG
jgi:excisionase family DNA binding protein